jgi:hypothetical protein
MSTTSRSSAFSSRSGTILIIVSGIAGLLSSLAVVFLVTVRSDLDDMNILVRETQARIMLSSACAYIQEASRIGWDTGTAGSGTQTEFSEAAGWIDVRDGELGPRLNTAPYTTPNISSISNVTQFSDPQPYTSPSGINMGSHITIPDFNGVGGGPGGNFPIGVPQIFPMYVMVQPPYAIQLTAAYNPVQQASPDSGYSYLRYPDPQPATDNGYNSGTVSASNFQAWSTGNRTPRENSWGMSWYRLVREPTGAVFTVTCGAGGTQGYRTWGEVQIAKATQTFNNDQYLFNSLSDDEVRIWYRVEWSPATCAIDTNYLHEGIENFFLLSSHTYSGNAANNGYSGTMMAPNMGGTIQWIQRLSVEPPIW